MIVRRGGTADVPALAQLQDIQADEIEAYAGWVTAHAQTHLLFVADVDGHVAGAAWLLVAERVPRPGSWHRLFGDIQSVMVRPEFRRRGVGSALIAAVLAEARTRGLGHVTVHSGRRAVGFWLRQGFVHHRQLLLWEPAGEPA